MVQPTSAGNPLSAGSLGAFMAASLSNGELKNGYEAVALAVHAGMIAVGFRLVGLGEDHRIEAHSDAQTPESLPAEWNASSSYAFRYKHAQSAMEYLVKVTRLGGKAIVNALADGDDKVASFDVVVKEYISESSLPLNLPESTSIEEVSQKLQDVFISTGRLNDLSALLKISVIQKLAPSLQKEGYEEERQRHVEAERREAEPERSGPRPADPYRPPRDPDPARPYPYNDPLAMPPRGPNRPLPEPIPGFEDEYEINRPRPGLRDDRLPAGIGHDDLYPPGLGPHDPLGPSFGGGLPRPGGFGGGMHPTFDDPLFRGQGGQGGYDPRAPPGARYDPVGPSDPLRDNSHRGGGSGGFPGGGFGGGAPHNPFGSFGGNDFI